MSSWSMVVSTASLIALIVMLWWGATREPTDAPFRNRPSLIGDAAAMRRILLVVAGVGVSVAAVAFIWSLTRPS